MSDIAYPIAPAKDFEELKFLVGENLRVLFEEKQDTQISETIYTTNVTVNQWEQIAGLGANVKFIGQYDDFNAAIASIGSTVTTLIVDAACSMSAAVTVPTTCGIVITKSGSINNGGHNLTINGPFEAGLYQVFSGAGSVAGLGFVNAMWFGAVADSSTDNATAFTKAAAAVNAQTNSTLWIPESKALYYDFSSGFSITADRAKLICDGELRYTGTSGAAITLGEAALAFNISAEIRLHKQNLDWTETCTGVRLMGLRQANVTIHKASRFTYGIEFNGAGGTYYSHFHLTEIINNRIGLYFGGDSGTMNANNFYGGQFYDSNLGGANYGSSYGIYIPYDATWPVQGNTFYSPRFETNTSKKIRNYISCGGTANTFIHPRFEDACSDIQVRFITGSAQNVIVTNDSGWIYDQSNLNSIIDSRGYIKLAKHAMHSYSASSANYVTWLTGHRWINYGINSRGDSPGKICITAGSYLPAPGITADTSNGSGTVTVSDASKVVTGYYINIVGVTGPLRITRRNCIDNELSVSPVADATVNGAALTMQNPTFVNEAPVFLSGNVIWDPGSIADGDERAETCTVTGAVLGDYVIASCSIDVEDLTLTANVTSADTVTFVLANNIGAAKDLGSAAFRAIVLKHSLC